MIEKIREVIGGQRYEYTLHAVDQSILRHITRREIEEAIESGETIEDYPNDKYGPSCLIHGITGIGRHLHIHCSYSKRLKVKIITLYEPDSRERIDYKERRSL